MPDPIANAPQPDATAEAPQQIQQTSAPVASQLRDATQGLAVDPTSPQAAPQQRPVLQPAAPAPSAASLPITATSPNKGLHRFIGSVLGALAGPETPTYTQDANGQLVANRVPPRSTADKVRAIAEHALIGLSAPEDPNLKSGLAKGLGGLGVGAAAVNAEQQKELAASKAQARQDAEMKAQTELRHMEIGKQNALTTSIYFENLKRANDLDPHFSANQSLFDAVKNSPELGAHATEMTDAQAAKAEAVDHMFTQTHILKPLGWAPATDEKGNPVLDANGQPTKYMRIGVIDGTKDGKIAITPQMAADFAQFGPMARIAGMENLKAGDEYDMAALIPALNKVEEQRKVVLDGWQKSELGWVDDPQHPGTQLPVEINKAMPPDMAGRVRPLTATPLAMAAEQGKTKLEKAQADEAEGKAKESLANAALIASTATANGTFDKTAIPAYMDAVNNVKQTNPNGYVALRNIASPIDQANILKIANGDAEVNKLYPTRTSPKSGQMDARHAAGLAAILNPGWTEQLYATKQKALTDFSTGEDGKDIARFNQFFVHADDARQASERLKRSSSPWVNQPLNKIRSQGMGEPGVQSLMASIMAARSEFQSIIKSGHASDIADNDQARIILSDASNPAQVVDALQGMGRIGIGRLDQINDKWKRTWGGDYPGLVSESGRQAATNLGLGQEISKYKSATGAFGNVQPNSSQGGQPQSGQPQNPSQIPEGMVQVQLPGQQPGFIPKGQLDAFRQKYPNATVSQ